MREDPAAAPSSDWTAGPCLPGAPMLLGSPGRTVAQVVRLGQRQVATQESC